MRTTPLLTAIFFSMFVPSQLYAGIVERDFHAPGDGLLTYDEVNQREWLDLTYTHGMKLSTIQSQMYPGGILEGFQLATPDDVELLTLSADVSSVDGFRLPGPSGPGPENLVGLFDWVVSYEGSFVGNFEYTLGQVATDFLDGEPVFGDRNVIIVWHLTTDDFVYSVNNHTLPGRDGLSSSSGGYFVSPPIELPGGEIVGEGDTGPFWLFRAAAAVPEPSSIALMLIGAAFVCSRNFRR